MGMHIFEDTRPFTDRLDHPLYPALTVAAVKALSGGIARAFKKVLDRTIDSNVALDTTDQMYAQRDVTILVPLALYNVQKAPVKIQMAQFNITDFHTAKAAAIKQADQQFVLQQIRTLQHTPDLFPTQDHRQFLRPLDRRQLQVIVRKPLTLQQKAKAINGMLEIRLAGCLASLLQFVEIVLYLLRIKIRRKALKM